MAEMTQTDYDATVADVAKDLRLNEAALREKFRAYLQLGFPDNGGDEWAACYAVYRLTKSRWAFRVASKSRDDWREQAIRLGSPEHLRDS